MEPEPAEPEPAAAAAAAAIQDNGGQDAVPMEVAVLSESIKLEHQLLRVPFEHLKKTMRANHRDVEREVSSIISGVQDATKVGMSGEQAVQHLNSLVSRLHTLKRKLEEDSKSENMQAQKCRARLEHLDALGIEPHNEWNSTRLDRILVDYMLRMSYYKTAKSLAERSHIQDLVDNDVFRDAEKVIDALRLKNAAAALSWCSENKSRLKKSKSILEFQIRLQEFIEHVRIEENLRAIEYARKYLAPWGTTHMKELQRVMATLAFKSTTECPTYKVLFEEKQWDLLVEQFKQEFCKIYGMTLQPLLNIYLQAGLSALKTPFCCQGDCSNEDPLSQASFMKLASSLPCSKPQHSKVLCYISNELMDTENPPKVLPNGYVYGTKALQEMAEKNGGKITCPRTGSVYNYTDLEKFFLT